MSKRFHDKNNFGGFIYELRKECGVGFEEFRQALGVSKAYLNDVETNACRPPTAEIQIKMIWILKQRADIPIESERRFFDLAAKQRGELPADVMRFLIESDGALNKVRQMQEYDLYRENIGL